MAQIVLIIAANQKTGEAQRIHTLGHKPSQWCHDRLKLEPDPIQLGTNIEVINSEHVLVRVDDGEKGPLQPALYESDLTPTVVKELLREL